MTEETLTKYDAGWSPSMFKRVSVNMAASGTDDFAMWSKVKFNTHMQAQMQRSSCMCIWINALCFLLDFNFYRL